MGFKYTTLISIVLTIELRILDWLANMNIDICTIAGNGLKSSLAVKNVAQQTIPTVNADYVYPAMITNAGINWAN